MARFYRLSVRPHCRMGKSTPTIRNMIERRREETKHYRRALRAGDQPSYDALWTAAAYDAPAIKMARTPDVDWLMLFAMLRDHQAEIADLHERLDRLQNPPEA